MADRKEIESCLQSLPQAVKCKDYEPNTLQVEGCCDLRHIASRVTAHQISEAPARKAAPLGVPCSPIEIENPA